MQTCRISMKTGNIQHHMLSRENMTQWKIILSQYNHWNLDDDKIKVLVSILCIMKKDFLMKPMFVYFDSVTSPVVCVCVWWGGRVCGDWPGEGEGLLSPLSPHHLHITLRLCQLIITLKCDPPGENKSMSISCTV